MLTGVALTWFGVPLYCLTCDKGGSEFEFAVDDIKFAYSKSDTVRIMSQFYPIRKLLLLLM